VIGRYPPWDPDKARTEAGVIIGEVYKGVDPLNKKQQARKQRLAAVQAPTLK
jgi:hypothetical protein